MRARLLVAAVGVPFLLLVLLVLPPFWTMALCAIMSAIAAYEMIHAAGAGLPRRIVWYSVVFAAAAPVIIYYGGQSLSFAAALAALMLLMFLDLIFSRGSRRASNFPGFGTVLFSAVLIPLMFSCLMLLRTETEHGRIFVMLPLVAAFSSDTLAFFTGLRFGKHKLAPLVSPKKTIEGALGGLVGGVVGMLLMGLILKFAVKYDTNFSVMALYGFIGSLLGQIGDLSFSAIKREYDIKDYGKLLPGHGGVLDRFDSVLFVAPLFWMLLKVLMI